MFNQTILSDIRDRISIVSLIGEKIPLKKAGRNFKAACPFHNEKTPSLMVSDEKQIFHCFGCGEGGDIFKFVMKYEGISFIEAVKELAGRAGVELPKETFSKDASGEAKIVQKKRWSYRVNQIASEYFHSLLLGRAGENARNYLKSRGIKSEILTQHFLGFAEKGWEGLVSHLKVKGVPLQLAAELGLVKEREKKSDRDESGEGHYDFFRNRIIFPIFSVQGEVVGFSGRTLDLENEDAAKYLNSPDSLIYHKSNSVYGLNRAKEDIRRRDQVIFVEGNLDLISLHQEGIGNVVAPLGTALTVGHLRLVSRFTKNIVLVFDGDEAGCKAAVRSLPLFIELLVVARAAALPLGEDPDSFVRKNGRDSFLKLVDNAPTLFEFVADSTAKVFPDDMAGRIETVRRLVPILRDVKDPVEAGMYKGYLAKRLKIKEEIINDALRGGGNSKLKKWSDEKVKSNSGAIQNTEEVDKAERLLIETMVRTPDMAKRIFEKISADNFKDEWCKTVFDLLSAEAEEDGKFNLSSLIENLADQDIAAQLRAIAMTESGMDLKDTEQLVSDCVEAMERRPLFKGIDEINEEIKNAESSGDEKKLLELLARKRDMAAVVAK